MKENRFIATLSLFLGLTIITSCSLKESDLYSDYEEELVEHLSASEQEKVSKFESSYLSCHSNKTRSGNEDIVLVGYKTVSYHGEDSAFVNTIWEHYKKEIEATNYTLTLDGKVRIYFRMKDAIILIDGTKYVADSIGVVHDVILNSHSVIEAIGSEKSRQSVKTIFARRYKHEKIYLDQSSIIFNLGERFSCCAQKKMLKKTLSISEDSSGSGSSNVSCTQNHPGFPNCSKAYNITTERCMFMPDRCMNYNGYGTDCSGSHLYFVGSDCSVAMALGHCWNEYM